MAGVAAPADKRFRRPDARPGRRRWTHILTWRMGAIALAVVVTLGAVVGLAGMVLGSSLFAVDRVVVRGNVRLSAGEVEALADGLRGENILRLDFDRYRRQLMDSPWVSGVTLWRVLPSTVEVRIAERTPMVVARLGQQLYLVDDEGVIIDAFGPQYKDFDLPVVDGLVGAPAAAGPLVDPARVRLTRRFLDALRAQRDMHLRVSQIDVSDPHDIVVLLDNDSALLHVGESRFVERLTTYLQIAPTLRGRVKDMDYVDLRFDERVYVRSRTNDKF
jgi:cell division septal protein FtsQ